MFFFRFILNDMADLAVGPTKPCEDNKERLQQLLPQKGLTRKFRRNSFKLSTYNLVLAWARQIAELKCYLCHRLAVSRMLARVLVPALDHIRPVRGRRVFTKA